MNTDSESGPRPGTGDSGTGASGTEEGVADSRSDDVPWLPSPGRRDLQVQNPNRYPEAAARALRPWLERVVDELAPEAGSLTVRFVGDLAMRRLNRDYRHQDKPTDVLTFPGDLPPRRDAVASWRQADAAAEPPGHDPFGERHLGDVVVSVPTARRQAAARGHQVERELRLLVLHGLLHCLGYDHEVDDGTMERVEARLRRRWLAPLEVAS